MTPLERSATYGGFAAAFRSADGGSDVLDTDLVPRAPDDNAKTFIEAFDPSVSKRAVSLHASSHQEREQTDLYQELIRWYAHFGLKRRDGGELPDHLAVMLEFLQFLTMQESTNGNDQGAVSALHSAQGDFISRHLMPLLQAIIDKLETEEPRYRKLPQALLAYLQEELASLQSQLTS